MMCFVKCRYIRGSLLCRRRKRAVLAIWAVAGLFLILHLENSATPDREHEEEHGALHEELLYNRITKDEHVRDKLNRTSDYGLRNVPLNNNHTKVFNEVSDTAQETAEKKNHACSSIIEKPRFREIVKGVLVYSVWFDNRQSQHFIRILLLTTKTKPPSLTCLFKNASESETFAIEASFYEHNENYQRRFGGFIASCAVPQSLYTLPCSVNISALVSDSSERNAMVFPVSSINRQNYEKSIIRTKYGICIPPVHGEVSVDKVIEFLELTQILGASHFTFYDLTMSDSVRNVLNYYEEIGLVSVFPWNLPSYIGKDDLHYFGQPLAIWECLFRSMRDLDFVAFHDLDEFIVPLRHENVSVLLEYIHKEEHCGHCFESVLFDLATDQNCLNCSHLITQQVFHRTSQVTPYWTKCIVDPRRIFEQGIHHISKPIDEIYHADKVNWELARVFHYRKCKDPHASFQPSCSALIVDKTMQRFRDKLLRNVELRMNVITEHQTKS